MSQFVFFTKTNWQEPPRLRHQLARLLSSAGHHVNFYERPRPFWAKLDQPYVPEERVKLLQYRELINHQLRLLPPLHRLNATFVKSALLKNEVKRTTNDTIIVNFNYDYFFLRELFPNQKLITVINDDFEANSRFAISQHISWALSRTCRISDRVLTVSTPLLQRLSRWSKPELFFPWSDIAYRPPAIGVERDTLLFWGYINNKIDFHLLYTLADTFAQVRPKWRLLFVGPQDLSIAGAISKLRHWSNVTFEDASPLDKLPIDRIFCSIIPYTTERPDVAAISLPNKALQLLARGLPLLISGMPAFIQKQFIFRFGLDNVVEQAERCRTQFCSLQVEIRTFVESNSPSARLTQFLRLLN